MKSLTDAVVIIALLAAPIASFAQSSQPLTRAQVREELSRVEEAGFNPARSNPNEYPANIQAAEARMAAQNGGDGVAKKEPSQTGNAAR